MTNENFIRICKKYAKENYKWLNPDNLKAITPFYQRFKKFCNENLRNEDDEDSVYDWLEEGRHNPNIMIDNPNANFIGHDPIDGHKILVLGKLKDDITPKTQIKRGNEKELINEINSKIKEILGYDTFFHEGNNHIEFRDKKGNDLYVIEWHFDPNYKEDNIVKRVCKELNITQRELAEIIKVNAGTPAQWVSKGEVPPTYQYLLELMLENKHLKEKIAKLTAFKELLNEI
ncbi:helix-turn-helix domain-containing protein [Campylobacter concisus]|uniref:helix-turn-helix domain-containing protein n=1 Tax=Campylobacter concisus TaxID=199 RepID=UPI0021564F59|nr:helix-turn-helix transcriptional regulator [Campylobacter concisus]